MNLSDRIESVELKIRQLALRFRQLQEENGSLRAENERLNNLLDQKEATVKQLHNRLEDVQHTFEQQQAHEAEKSTELKVQIDSYIKEIDKCIEWLRNN